jgi:hemerythrin superfamily protein
MANVFDVLAADHELTKALLNELGHGAVEGRQKRAEELVIAESRHEAIEEMYFWPAVRQTLPGGDDLADTAVAQETEGKRVLDQLDKAGAAAPEFPGLLATFSTLAFEHIAFEEREVWPKLRAALGPDAQDELGSKLESARSAAPTRPHPHTPAAPEVLKTAGAAVAAVDKVRDVLSGRDD